MTYTYGLYFDLPTVPDFTFDMVEAPALVLETPEIPQLDFLTDLDGKSLYMEWLELGHSGTTADFLEWLSRNQKIEGLDAHINNTEIHVTRTEILSLADKHHSHSQGVPAAMWTVIHNMGKYPSLTVIDNEGNELEGDVTHLDYNQLTITFSAPVSGRAELN